MTGAPSEAVLNESELIRWGARVGRAAVDSGIFVALFGELGAGKSTVVRAACRALGVDGSVPSPTFTIMNQHAAGDRVVHHADLYRLDPPVREQTLLDAGWTDLLDAEDPVFVEWADRADGWLPPDRWEIRLRIDPAAPDLRFVQVLARGAVPAPPLPGTPC